MHCAIITRNSYERLIVKGLPDFSANEQGVIDSVKVMKGFDENFDNETVRVVKSIPEWDVFYRRGQHERRALNLLIIFSEENKKKYKNN